MMRFLRPETYDYAYLAPIALGPQASEAEAELRRAVEGSPSTFTTRFLLGFFLETQGRPEALDHYLAASDLNPTFAFTHYQLGRRAGGVALGLGRWSVAESIVTRAIEAKEPSADLRLMLAIAHHKLGKLAEAEAGYRAVLATDPRQPTALVNLGFILDDTGRSVEGPAGQ